ncbi:DUF4178 domain-containing protein [Novosphingobium sp. B 225]|uniref:DUF4178 domain-containing protein n=1 Tax=Novosphingobium sp. B 225 TaxID=1961849 RepID=UPI000B4BB20A|nr:DUF4178 domain-containing protein [Novosphingobium sp. B 225]
MAELPCPSCGAPVPVRSAALPYVTCAYCQTLIRRHGEGLEAIGKSAVLPFDVSPIQLGTTGSFGPVRFSVAGRVRWGWNDGSWNEWLLDCSDGHQRWLAEAMGSYMLTQEHPELLRRSELAPFAAGGSVARGTSLTLDAEEFEASDIKTARCLGSEGDLPRPTPAGAEMLSIDFRGTNGGAISLQRDSDGASAWIGAALELSQLSPKNLRQLDGWSIPADLR